MTLDPITGPIPRDKFVELIAMPFGHALKVIRKYDPLWGRAPGEKFRWLVEVERERLGGYAYVEAATEEEAEKLADKLTENDIDWGYDDLDEFSITSVKPG